MKPLSFADPHFGARAVFPGEIAGASLKHVMADGVWSNQTEFSPAKSPGPH